MFAVGAALLAASLGADAATRDRVSQYFAGLVFRSAPNTQVSVVPAVERRHPRLRGLPGRAHVRREEPRRDLHRRSWTRLATRSSWARSSTTRERRNQPFVPSTDLPVIRTTLQDTLRTFRSRSGSGRTPRGLADPARASPCAWPTTRCRRSRASCPRMERRCSSGEFRPFSVCRPSSGATRPSPSRPGVRTGKGSFAVTAFIDFQCEKCRQREPAGPRLRRQTRAEPSRSVSCRWSRSTTGPTPPPRAPRRCRACLPRSTRSTRTRSSRGPAR